MGEERHSLRMRHNPWGPLRPLQTTSFLEQRALWLGSTPPPPAPDPEGGWPVAVSTCQLAEAAPSES